MSSKTPRIIYDFITADESNVGMIIFTLFAFVFMNSFDVLGLKESEYWGEAGASIVYLLMVFLVYYLWVIIKLFFIRRKIIFRDVYFHETSKKVKRGNSYYAGLEIEIPEGWEITDCYMTLGKFQIIYGGDAVLLDPNISTWLASKRRPEFNRLFWKSPYAGSDGKITIGDNTNKEVLLVGQINMGYIGTDENSIEIKNFEFPLIDQIPNSTIRFESFGLYEISMNFYWKQNGKRMIPKPFSGYLYSTMRGEFPYFILKEDDYRKDKRIPHPILKPATEEVKNVSKEKPKGRKSTPKQQKRSPHLKRTP